MSILKVISTPNVGSSYYLVILSLAMFIALAYITTVLLKRSKFVSKGRNIHVIERFYLAADKILMIVQVGEVYYLMSYDKSGMKMLDKLDDFTPMMKEETQTKFADILKTAKMNKDQ
jgi:flagellar biogenesis protein FliO